MFVVYSGHSTEPLCEGDDSMFNVLNMYILVRMLGRQRTRSIGVLLQCQLC
jgi:hypothetical protein